MCVRQQMYIFNQAGMQAGNFPAKLKRARAASTKIRELGESNRLDIEKVPKVLIYCSAHGKNNNVVQNIKKTKNKLHYFW